MVLLMLNLMEEQQQQKLIAEKVKVKFDTSLQVDVIDKSSIINENNIIR